MRNGWFLAMIVVTAIVRLNAQEVFHAPEQSAPLAKAWDWAVREAAGRNPEGGMWIGYGIDRLMLEDSWIGSFRSTPDPDEITLYELITGRRIEFDSSVQDVARRALSRSERVRSEQKVMKEIAFLFEFREKPGDMENLRTIRVTNVTLAVDLDRMPLFWLGKQDAGRSLEFLISLFNSVSSARVSEKIVQAVGLHGNSPGGFEFLKRVLEGSGPTRIREEAAFWLGMLDTLEALKTLRTAAESNPSRKVSEKAVFAISQMSSEEATETLIDLGRNAEERETRKKAVFWLGQRASKNILSTIESFAYEDKDEEIQKQAVFALTQLPGDESVTHLIRIAKTHPNPRVRKQAVFWLGESDDPRAFETIVDIAKGK